MQEMLEKKVTAGLTASAVFSRSVRKAPEKTNKKTNMDIHAPKW